MKYNPANKILEFASDAEVLQFHNQLTEVMRAVMSTIGSTENNEEEASKLTKEFFERYSALTDTLSRLRAHLPRNVVSP